MSSSPLHFWQGRVLAQIDLTPCNGCDSCGIKCGAGVQMTRDEYMAVLAYIGSADGDEIARVSVQEKTVDLGDGITATMCRYRDMERGGCAVYPARPLTCRLLGHVEWMPCPIGKVERISRTEDAVRLMQEYAECERLTFEEWDRLENQP